MNLWLAILWLVGGVALIAWQGSMGVPGWRLRVGDYSLSPGWLMLLLATYNLARWWSSRRSQAEQRAFQLALARRRTHDRPLVERPIDPTFDFTRDTPPSQRPSTG